jgi:hypothetical protein
MTRKFFDLRRPTEPPPFISWFVLAIVAVVAFGLLVAYWH